jgi:transposase
MIGDRKMMVTIVWNPQDFHLVNPVPKGQKFNESYYIDIIIQPVLESRSTGSNPGLIIHSDNARPHTAQKTLRFCAENRLEMASHPLYSPDLTPYDFFLFRHVKHELDEAEFPSEEILLAAIQSAVWVPTVDKLRAIFTNWIEWLKWIALNKNHYYR